MSNSICRIPADSCLKTRRCFMTGEYCAKQADVHKARTNLHRENEINAFVVMNFSNMSDIVYKWRLVPFIEELKDRLFFDKENNALVCTADPLSSDTENESLVKVKKINVIRADSSFASNFLICNRICQSMQIADLIVVDVSMKNANVFYEMGMAIAMGKLILPVCFSESFYDRKVPQYFQKEELNGQNIMSKLCHHNNANEQYGLCPGTPDIEACKNCLKRQQGYEDSSVGIGHHIGMFPWRKRLFENFGIRYKEDVQKQNSDKTGYTLYANVANPEYGFSDLFYNCLPYNNINWKPNGKHIGQSIYERLYKTYNGSSFEHNTVVIYTMDGFLNEQQAADCIINYYTYFTQAIKESECFCGDRVGVLAQSNHIPERDKDDAEKHKRDVMYSTGQAIYIGVNEATYDTQRKLIKPDDYINVSIQQNGLLGGLEDSHFLKKYLGNKAMLIYPYTPVYCERIENGIQGPIYDLENGADDFKKNNKYAEAEHYFCLFHMMLRNLRYVREIVVDISDGNLEALFWLGMAHGADAPAISVKRKETEHERIITTGSPNQNERTIMDIAGLWYAEFSSSGAKNFYESLRIAHQEIELHGKLLLPNLVQYESEMMDLLYASPENKPNAQQKDKVREDEKWTEYSVLDGFQRDTRAQLESYYRSRLWSTILRDNHLDIYVHKKDENLETSQSATRDPRANISSWDFKAAAALSRYLALRTPVDQYRIIGLGDKKYDANQCAAGAKELQKSNFVGIGAYPVLYTKNNVPSALKEHLDSLFNDIADFCCTPFDCSGECHSECRTIPKKMDCRGFKWNDIIYYTQLKKSWCSTQVAEENDNEQVLNTDEVSKMKPERCMVKDGNIHIQLAHLMLWREDIELPRKPRSDKKIERHFYISLAGASGPATYALTSLLVNDPLKEEILGRQNDDNLEEKHPLSEIQRKLRKEFIEKFCGECKNSSMNQELYEAAAYYLAATLYLYFLPFLTIENEQRIINSTQFFLSNFLYCKNRSKLKCFNEQKDDQKGITGIINTLCQNLKEFCGVEALYQVSVKIQDADPMDYDTRSVEDIKHVSGTKWIRPCLLGQEKRKNADEQVDQT